MPTDRCYFVTGANGYIGSRLVEALVARGDRVIALSRRAQPTAELPPGLGWEEDSPFASPLVEWRMGDITDAASIRRAMQGATHVFHLAAYARNWARKPSMFFDMNVQGMRNVLDVAAEQNIERIVWTSSVVTRGPSPRGQVRTEDDPRITPRFFNEYERTKAMAEQEAMERAAAGLPVVIVLPTRVYGPGFLNESNSASLLIDEYDRGKMPFLLNRGVNVGNWVYIDDVVRGHLLAMDMGRVGERYLLGGENASLKEFFQTVDRVSGKRHFQWPLFKVLPMALAWGYQARATCLGIHPLITPGWMRSFLVDWAYSTEKAERELGYRPTPLTDGVRRTYDWLVRIREQRKRR